MAISRALILLAALVVAGCSSAPAEIDYSAVCPAKQVRMAVENQQSLQGLMLGNRLVDIEGLREPEKMVSIVGPGDAKRVALFRVGVANCPFMSGSPNFMPVVIDADSTVMGMGNHDIQKLFDQGYTIPEAKWNWQSYNFAYLPHR